MPQQRDSLNIGRVVRAAYRRAVLRPAARLIHWRRSSSARQVWVHIGAHKTASTLVQSILRRRRDRLPWYGILYYSHGYHLGKTLLRDSPLPQPVRERMRAEIQQDLDRRWERVAILSSEGLFGDPYRGYANIGAIAEDLAVILDGYDVHIVAVIRRQDQFMRSAYQQYIKSGHTETFEQFHELLEGRPYEWDKLLDSYAAVFGAAKMRVVTYEQLTARPGHAVEVLFHGCGRAFRCRMKMAGRPNPGLSWKGAEIQRRCNELLDPEERVRLRRFLEREFARQPHGRDIDERAYGEAVAVLAEYRESNLRCFRKYISDADEALLAAWGLQESRDSTVSRCPAERDVA